LGFIETASVCLLSSIISFSFFSFLLLVIFTSTVYSQDCQYPQKNASRGRATTAEQRWLRRSDPRSSTILLFSTASSTIAITKAKETRTPPSTTAPCCHFSRASQFLKMGNDGGR